MLCVLVLACWPHPGHGQTDGADTEHMFGFSEGSDIGRRGESEAEFETIGRFGRNASTYRAITTNAEFKHVLTDNFRISGAAAFSLYNVAGQDGFPDQNRVVLDRISSEMRYHALDRMTQPIGLTFIATPFYGFVDPSSGVSADRWGVNLIAAMDRALVPEKVYAALNVGYGLEQDRYYFNGAFANSSTLSFNGAAVGRLEPWLYLGGEVRYLLTYNGLTPDALAGQAIYLGPVFYLPVAKGFTISGAWDFQTWGQARSVSGTLDLTNFERSQVKLRLSIDL